VITRVLDIPYRLKNLQGWIKRIAWETEGRGKGRRRRRRRKGEGKRVLVIRVGQ